MKKSSILFFIFPLLSIGLSGCEYLDYLKEESEVVVEQLTVGDYNQIIVGAPYQIVFVDSEDTNTITIEGQQHLVNDVDISVSDHVLKLGHYKSKYIQKKKRPTLYLNANNFYQITVNNITSLQCEAPLTNKSVRVIVNGRGCYSDGYIKVECTSFDFRCYSSNQVGNYYFEGNCEQLSFNLEGSVNFYGEDLIANSATITHRSIGDCYITANQKLNINIYTNGDTYYYGNPELTTTRVAGTTFNPSGNVYAQNE